MAFGEGIVESKRQALNRGRDNRCAAGQATATWTSFTLPSTCQPARATNGSSCGVSRDAWNLRVSGQKSQLRTAAYTWVIGMWAHNPAWKVTDPLMPWKAV
jgi:hypothetical protein